MLKPVSWAYEDLAGPYSYWNRSLDYRLRGDSRFSKEMVKMIFAKHGVHGEIAEDASQWIATYFIWTYSERNRCFWQGIKRDAKPDGSAWRKLFPDFTKDEAQGLLKFVLNEVRKAYDRMI